MLFELWKIFNRITSSLLVYDMKCCFAVAVAFAVWEQHNKAKTSISFKVNRLNHKWRKIVHPSGQYQKNVWGKKYLNIDASIKTLKLIIIFELSNPLQFRNIKGNILTQIAFLLFFWKNKNEEQKLFHRQETQRRKQEQQQFHLIYEVSSLPKHEARNKRILVKT